MGYIHELLLDGEIIEQTPEQHWWPVAKPAALTGILFVGWITTWLVNGFLNSLGWPLIMLVIFPWLVGSTIDYHTTEYVVTSERVFKKRGWISRKSGEIARQKLEKVVINQGIVGRLLGFGTIQFSGTGTGRITFTYVLDPASVKRNLSVK